MCPRMAILQMVFHSTPLIMTYLQQDYPNQWREVKLITYWQQNKKTLHLFTFLGCPRLSKVNTRRMLFIRNEIYFGMQNGNYDK